MVTIVTILLIGVLGIAVGGVTCAVLRRRWNLKAVAIDAVLAMIVFCIAVQVIGDIQIRLSGWPSALKPALVIAAVTIIARELLRGAPR